MYEKIELIKIFNNNFNFLKNEPIVLYGIGYRTEILVNNLSGYNIIGLMDSYSSGYKAYGINVINQEEAIKLTKNIILVCIYESAKVIYKNISYLENYGINIYHVSGKRMKHTLLIESKDNYFLIRKEQIKKYIDDYDIISFDIFDTLITRISYTLHDIFKYSEIQIKEQLNLEIDFLSLRILSEKEAYFKYRDKTTIDDIYNILNDKLHIDSELIKKIKIIEIETEKKFLIKREEVIELLEYSICKNKKVIFISDMYFNSNIIKDILETVGIIFNNKMYISCDIGKSKHNGSLWEYISNEYKGMKILHIGDNENSDIIQSNKYDIKGIKINSPLDSYNNSIMKENFKNYDFDLYGKLVFGNFISHLFNSPFKNYSSPIKIDSHFDVGYLFFGPLIYNFMIWLVNSCKKNNINKILFIARDGYILNLVYKYIDYSNIENIYFYSSRQSLSVISIFSEKDIIDNIEINYKTSINMKATLNSFVKNRLGIELHKYDKLKDLKLFEIKKEIIIKHVINNYKEKIISNSAIERNEYFKYLDKIGINHEDNIAFVNFVGAGATQYYIEKLFKNNMYFYYFGTNNRISSLNLKSNYYTLYGNNLDQALSNNPLVENSLISEAVFTSPEGQFIKFINNDIIFAYDEKERYNLGIDKIHKGIEKFFIDMHKIGLKLTKNTELILDIYNIFFNDDFSIKEEFIKNSFIILDPFLHEKRTLK